MEWKVQNALNRDVERQHLNKILKDIRSTVDALSTNSSSVTEIRVREIVRGTIPPPPKPPSFKLTLVGDVSGSATLDGNTTLATSLDVDVLPEVPPDGAPYWRRFGEWEAIPMSVFAIAMLEDAGFVVTNPETGEVYSREFETRAGELDVVNANGIEGNPLIGLSDLENTGTGDGVVRTYTRDAKGRIEGDEAATTDNLPEGEDNLYFTEERSHDATAALLQNSDDIHFEYDENVPAVYAHLSEQVWEAISNVVNVVGTPTDADIIEFDETINGWVPKKNPRELLLDGGNF